MKDNKIYWIIGIIIILILVVKPENFLGATEELPCIEGESKTIECNACACTDGGWMCTELYCEPCEGIWESGQCIPIPCPKYTQPLCQEGQVLEPRINAQGCTFSVCIEEPLVGGDEDEHGCIASAGYTWCEEKEKCIRTWEEECEEQILECTKNLDCTSTADTNCDGTIESVAGECINNKCTFPLFAQCKEPGFLEQNIMLLLVIAGLVIGGYVLYNKN